MAAGAVFKKQGFGNFIGERRSRRHHARGLILGVPSDELNERIDRERACAAEWVQCKQGGGHAPL
jgi:hypothetical protein